MPGSIIDRIEIITSETTSGVAKINPIMRTRFNIFSFFIRNIKRNAPIANFSKRGNGEKWIKQIDVDAIIKTYKKFFRKKLKIDFDITSHLNRHLEMYRLSIRIEYALMHHLAQSRMREDRVHEFGFGGFERFADGVALDHFRYFCTDHVGTE